MASEEIRHVRSSVDFSKLPESLGGKWVVVRREDRKPLGSGDTPEEAFVDAGVSEDTAGVVITRVPSRFSVF